MRRRYLALIVTLLGGLVAACAAQSQPEQQPQQSSSSTAQAEQKPGDQTPAPKPKAKHVFTNDDIPSSPDADKPSSNTSQPAAAVPAVGAKISANDMREIVRKQKTRLAQATSSRDKLQALMDKLPKSDCRNLYYPDDPKKDVCTDVAKIPGKLKQAQSQVDREQSTLEQLQDQARKMGYGSSVYDPD